MANMKLYDAISDKEDLKRAYLLAGMAHPETGVIRSALGVGAAGFREVAKIIRLKSSQKRAKEFLSRMRELNIISSDFDEKGYRYYIFNTDYRVVRFTG